jgi:hypothetical protein
MKSALNIGARLAAAAAFLLVASTAMAQEACGLCEKEITTNGDLAQCFLEEYDTLAGQTGAEVVVDLNNCEASRGVVEALPTPNAGTALPDLEFMISRAQLECLKRKLEEPGLVLDPSITISLDSCS